MTRWNVIRMDNLSDKLMYNKTKFKKILKVHLDHMSLSDNPPKHDKLMIFTWNIETYTERSGDNVPMAEFKEDEVFMICIAVYWSDQKPVKAKHKQMIE